MLLDFQIEPTASLLRGGFAIEEEATRIQFFTRNVLNVAYLEPIYREHEETPSVPPKWMPLFESRLYL